MGWANIMTPEFIASTGVTGVLLIISLIAIVKIYKDMREDINKREKNSKDREDKLMEYLDKKSETDKHVAKTLSKIDKRLQALENCSNNYNKKSKK